MEIIWNFLGSPDDFISDPILLVDRLEFGCRDELVRESPVKQDASIFDRISYPFDKSLLGDEEVNMLLV